MEGIQLLQITLDELKKLISDGVGEQLDKRAKQRQYSRQIDEYLTRNETAALLKINLSTLYRWTKSKRITAYALENKVYYKRSDIEARMVELYPNNQ